METKENNGDYDLDGLENIDLTSEQIDNHKLSRRITNSIDIGLLIGIPLAGTVYGAYSCLPNHTRAFLDNLPDETYRVCSDLYLYLAQFIS